MSRTLGYIIIAIAGAIGVAALLLPVPEQIEVEPHAPVAAAKPAARPAKREAAPKPAARPAPKPTPPPAVKSFPRQDTTKSRAMMKPNA